MDLFTRPIREQLLLNGQLSREHKARGAPEPDFVPVVKLFTPGAGCIWLLTELDPEEPDIAFGLCDLGNGFPEIGSVRVSELKSFRGKMGLAVERDFYFQPNKTLTAYADEAVKERCIAVGD